MVTQELIDYIKSELQKGTDVQIITSTLAAKGWSIQDIQEAITKVQQSTESTSTPINNTTTETQNENQNPNSQNIIYVRLIAAFFLIFPFILFVTGLKDVCFFFLSIDTISSRGVGIGLLLLLIGTMSIGIGLLLRKSFFWYLAMIVSVPYLSLSLVLGMPLLLSKLLITQSFGEIILPLVQIVASILIVFLLIRARRFFILQDVNDSAKGKLKAAVWGLGMGIIPFILLMWISWSAFKDPLPVTGWLIIVVFFAIPTSIFAVLGIGILVFIGKRKGFTSSQILISMLAYLLIIFSPLIAAGLLQYIHPVLRAKLIKETQAEYLVKKLSFEVLREQVNSQDRTIDVFSKIKNNSGKELNVGISRIYLVIPKKSEVSYPGSLNYHPWIAEDINLVSDSLQDKAVFPQKNEEKFLLSPGENVLNFKLKMIYDSNGISIYNPQMDKQRAAEVAKFLASLSYASVCGNVSIEGVRVYVNDYTHCGGAQYFGQTKLHDWVNLSY